jgi:dGTPase
LANTGEEATAPAAAYGGFDHNAQALRIVTQERHATPNDGLNLT